MTEIASSIYEDMGWGGLFVGLRARLIHAITIIVIQLICYDEVKALFGIPLTGST